VPPQLKLSNGFAMNLIGPVRQAQALKEWTEKHAAERAAKQPVAAG